MSSRPRLARLRRAMHFSHPHRRAVAAILAFTLTAAAIGALDPLVLKMVVDRLDTQSTLPFAVLAGLGAMVVLGILREALSSVSNWLTWRTRIFIQYDLLSATVDRLHCLPIGYHRDEGVGAIMTKLDRSIQGFVGAVGEIAFNVVPAIAYLAIAVVVMARLDWRLCLLVLTFAPLPALIAARAAPTQTRREKDLLNRWAKIYARFNEVLSGILTVRSFAMEDAEKRRFLGGVQAANDVVVRGVRFDTTVGAAQNLVVLLARMAALGAGSYLVVRGQVTLGTVVAFLGYVGGLFGPVQGLAGIYKTLRTASVSLDQIFGILDAQEHLGDAPDARELPPVVGRITFENVTFSYDHDGPRLLDRVNLTIEPGEMVALVGPSGAGKSTLMALLQRFYDPTDGVVRIDGLDLRALKQRSIRRNVGVVLQDPSLFNDTVRSNIAYGRPEATQHEVEAAARAANAHEFIMRLPDGYETKLGERGARLSVGERQRIAIARVLVKDAPILILDEATSALDAAIEAKVQEALERLMRGRTTIVIAHRLSTIVNANRILVLKDGHIIERGRHLELVAGGGYYAHLVAQQTRGLVLPQAS